MRSQAFFAGAARAVLAHRAAAALALMAGLALAATGLRELRIDFSALHFFASTDPEIGHLLDFERFWGGDGGELLVVVEADSGPLLEPVRLARLRELAESLDREPGVAEVVAFTDLPWARPGPEPRRVEALLATLPAGPEGPALADWRRDLLARAPYVPFLISADGRFAALSVRLAGSADDVAAVRRDVSRIEAVVAAHQGRAGLSYELAGIPVLRAACLDLLLRDQVRFAPAMLALMGLCLAFFFRCVHGVLIPLGVAVLPALLVLGAMGLTGEPLGLLNQVYLTLLPVLAVADSIHLLSRFHEEARRLGAPGGRLSREQRDDCIVRAVATSGWACTLTCVTTATGFLSLQVAAMPVLRRFGLYAALGIVLAYVTVMVAVPLLLSWVGRVPAAGERRGLPWVERAVMRCSGLALRAPAAVLTVTAAAAALSLWLASGLTADTWLTGMLARDHPAVRAGRHVDEHLGGVLPLVVDLAGAPGALREAQALTALQGFESWARRQPGVGSVLGPASVLTALNDLLVGDASLPPPSALGRLLPLSRAAPSSTWVIAADAGRGRVVLRVPDLGGAHFLELAGRVQEEARRRLAGTGLEPRVTGTAFVAYRGSDSLVRDLRAGLLLDFAAVALVVALLFRSARTGLACLVPNALPLVFGFGFLGGAGIELDLAATVIFTVALSLAVDDTLHLMVRFGEERRAGYAVRGAFQRALRGTGLAVVTASLALTAGFGIHVLSSFPMLVTFGALGAVLILAALLCELFVLPALLALLPGGRRW